MTKSKIIVGGKYGRLTAMGKALCPDGRSGWRFLCDCGNEKITRSHRVTSGATTSCGCALIDFCKSYDRPKKHGLANKTPEYKIWSGLKYRCYNPNSPGYERYGKSGVGISLDWFLNFSSFIRDMGFRPSKSHSLDRIDNSRGYEAGNCRWATKAEQANNRAVTIFLEHDGVKKPIGDWSRETGIATATLRYRILAGWSSFDVLTKPVRN